MADGYPSLRIVAGGREWVFDSSRLVTVGRGQGVDVLLDDPTISRAHGEFRPEAGGWYYHDVGSLQGTFRNGEPVTRVGIGGNAVTLRLGDPDSGTDVAASTVTASTASTADAAPPAPSRPAAPPAPSPRPAPPPPPPSPGPSPGPTPLDDRYLRSPSSVYRPKTEKLRIGRAADNDVAIADVQVSRYHAELRLGGAAKEIVDLGSRNGTYVNGRRIRSETVDDRSIIAIGSHTFRLVGDRLEEYVDEGEITFDAVDLSYELSNGRKILDGVSFPLDPSSFVAILGPTGAGKSTLAKALTGFQPATSGTVLYNRRDLYAAYDELRRRIGYVPQDDILHPQLTVGRALEYGAQLRFPPDVSDGERKERVREVMAELGLTEHAHTAVRNLSGGQRKRTSVALELLTKPALLFLDEPTSGLDPGYEKSVMTLLRELADAGRSVIVITHSVQSLDLCDSLLFLAKGGFTAYFGPPDEALGYFGSSDYPDVFHQLETRPGPEARDAFRRHRAHEAYVRTPLANRPAIPPAQPADVRLSVAGIRPRSELWVLIRRYLAVIAADSRNLRLLIAQAPLIALLVWSLAPADALAVLGAPGTPRGARNSASTVLLALTLGAAFMGLSNALREIVKELPVYQRERAVGMAIWSYLGSKAIVLGVITVVQAALLVLIGTWRQGHLGDGVTSLPPKFELFLAVALTGVAAMALGLLVSAMVTGADKALTLLPVLLLGLFLLAGPLFNLTDRPGLRELSYVTSTRWGYSALASTVDLEGIRGCKPADCQPSWNHSTGTWTANMTALVALTVVPLFIAAWALRRRDPLRSWKRARGRAAHAGRR